LLMITSSQKSKAKDDSNYMLPEAADLEKYYYGHWHTQNNNIQSKISSS